MPSGAKKRKAAKKKLQKQAHNNGAHPQGNEDVNPHDDRESDGGEVEREEGAGSNLEQGTKESSLEGETVGADAREVKNSGENFNDVTVEADDSSRDSGSGDASEQDNKSSSSSSSSSDDDEVEVQKEKPVVEESEVVEQQDQSSMAEPEAIAPNETPEPTDYVSVSNMASQVVDNSAEESIPVEESVKEVVSLPQESKENISEESPTLDEQVNVPSAADDLQQEKIESKVVQVVDDSTGNSSEPVGKTERNNEGLLPQSSGVTAVDTSGGYDNGKESEKHKYSEEQHLISSAPVPVRRTSWMSCCGLFEVLSGDSGR